MFYNIAMVLSFVFIFMLTHTAFNNGRMICLWTCKLITATYIWFLIWVITQLNNLPEWQKELQTSVQNVMNGTAFKEFRTSL